MPKLYLSSGRIVRAFAAACVAGTLFASSCSAREIGAIAATVEAAASSFDRGNSDDNDISFGDWLASEFGNL